MSKLVWDAVGEKLYETGVSNGVLYVQSAGAYPAGVPWNGLISVTESPEGAEPEALWADNIKYVNLMSAETFGATIEAYTYPDEFNACDGSAALATGVMVGQQARKPFGLVYKTRIGNDTEGDALGYKLHIIYGCTASPSEKGYQTVNDSPEAITFSWEVSTTPVPVTGFRPSATLVLDSTQVSAANMKAVEDVLFGSETLTASLPLPDAILALITP